LKRLLFLFLIGGVGALIFRVFLFEGIYIATDSMAPTLPTDRHIFISKFHYKFNTPKRGDIIVFPDPEKPQRDLVKRVIAIGGDVIGIYKKQVLLNGAPLDEPYKNHLRPDEDLDGDTIDPVRIPKDHVFVLGDNRDYSRDSRDWIFDQEWRPFLPHSLIKGKVMTNK